MCECKYAGAIVHTWRSENNTKELILSCYLVESIDWNQACLQVSLHAEPLELPDWVNFSFPVWFDSPLPYLCLLSSTLCVWCLCKPEVNTGYISLLISILFLETVSLIEVRACQFASLVCFWDPIFSAFQSGSKGTRCHAHLFYMDVGNLNLGPHVCISNTFPTELSSRVQIPLSHPVGLSIHLGVSLCSFGILQQIICVLQFPWTYLSYSFLVFFLGGGDWNFI